MRGRVFLGIVVSAFLYLSCEDPVTLSVSKAFGNNDLVTSFVDTFSVVTSTVQLDSILTGNTGVALLGGYSDPTLGSVKSSPYIQFGYSGSFAPGLQSTYDSIGLVMPFNKQYYGDSTQQAEFSIHQITEVPVAGTNPPTNDIKLSIFNRSQGFYSQRNVPYDPTPLGSYAVKFFPHKDSLYLKLPVDLGQKWFTRAQREERIKKEGGQVPSDSAFFNNSALFIQKYFSGLHIKTSGSTGNIMAGFNADVNAKGKSLMKIRIYYKKLVNDIMVQTRFDFPIQNGNYQFQNISYDRTATLLNGLAARQAIPSASTNHETYVQAGTGLVTRLDFPSLKSFFADKRHIFNGAYLEVYPVQGSYAKNIAPPSQLYVYTTDDSNVPTGSVSGGVASIVYDYEYGIRTLYTFSLFNYFEQQFSITNPNVTPLLLGPAQSQLGNNVQRVYIGDRFHPISKIKLKIFYSYAPN